MMEDSLNELCHELLLLRRRDNLCQEEREILAILLRTRPEQRRLARQLERMAALEAKAVAAPEPAGLHQRLRARLAGAPAPGARVHGLDALPWVGVAALVCLVCGAAFWLWMPALPWNAWGASLSGAAFHWFSGAWPSASLDATLYGPITLRTLVYACGFAVVLAAFLLSIDRDRRLAVHSEIPRERT